MLTKSLQKMEHQDFGLQTNNRYVLHLDPAGAGYKSEKLGALYQALEEQFAAIPGMQSVGLAAYSPLDGNQWDLGVYIPERPIPGPNDDNDALINRVSPDFLAAVGQQVMRGRGLARNNANSQSVAVNQAFESFPKQSDRPSPGIYEQQTWGLRNCGRGGECEIC